MENEKENNVSIWNVVETSIGRNAKVYRLADTLNIKIAETVGCLILFWGSVLEQREDGDVSLWTNTEIERYAGWEGEKGAFAKALYKKENPFIDIIEEKKLVHGWLDFAGRYLIKRYGTANREKLIEIWAKHGRSYGQSQEEEFKKPKRPKPEKKFADDSLEIKISKYLFEQIKKNDPKAKEPNFQMWAKHIDGLLRIDKRTKEEISKVLKWVQAYKGANGFTWKTNILSTQTLREKFTKLWTQMNEDQKKGKPEKPKTYKCDCGKTLLTSQKYTHESGECPIHKPADLNRVKEIIEHPEEESPEEIRKEINKQFPVATNHKT
jgi:hypothetical protein